MTNTDGLSGLLYLSYGTPRREEEILPYLASIRGRQPLEKEIQSLEERYARIGSFQGGLSPLNEMTSRQGQALVDYLNERGGSYILYEGYKHLEPSIEDAVRTMREDGIRQAVVINATPFYSLLGTADYGRRVQAAADHYGIQLKQVQAWWQSPAFLACWQEALAATKSPEGAYYIFSAHSIPAQAVDREDPYLGDLETFTRQLAQTQGLDHYCQAWQSAPPRGQWMEPKVEDCITRAFREGYKDIVLAPVGFISEHLEVLYDDDVVYRRQIEEAGGKYYRPPMPNDRDLLIEAMASAVVCIKG